MDTTRGTRPPARSAPAFRRRRRAAGAVLVLVLAALALAIEAVAGDGAVGPSPAQIEERRRDAVPDRKLIGQRLMVRMDGFATPGLARQAREGEIGGVIVFPPPGQPTDELKDEIAELQRDARRGGGPPLLVAIDQEGGEVKRVPDGPPARSPRELAAPGDEPAARGEGRRTGRFLATLGIDVDLAPVLDVARPGGFIAEQRRGFAAKPGRVSAAGVAFARGLQGAGVAATAKHFPGLGSTAANTDLRPSRIGLPARKLRRIDEAPYRRFVAAGGKLVMVSS
ncbi:MAG TPA: glycoside hydrolase family 3 N-terminal domain-containing protein, partial [Solirubrobacterales bacterium]|nr:glycoside hydrolase family 3 N-terminal domain-containing protein [Solirubrobacterales bacterium]